MSDPKFSKLRQKETVQSEATQEQQLSAASHGIHFQSAEAMIAHDASQITVPPSVAHRLNESIAQIGKPLPWWKRPFFRDKS